MEIYVVFLDENNKYCNDASFPKLTYKVNEIQFKTKRDFQGEVGKMAIKIHL